MTTAAEHYAEAHVERALADLERYCRQPTISAQGVGIAEGAALTAELLRAAGLDAHVLPTAGAPVVVGERRGRSPRTLLFYDHYDVQPPEPLDLWQSPPFEPTRREGCLFARGVADNKANIIARLFAVQALLATEGELPCGVRFVIEGEEEIGSPNLAAFVAAQRERLAADACIWETGGVNWRDQPTVHLGVKGILYVELLARAAARDVHSSKATLVPDAAWRLVWALATLKDASEVVRIAGFYDDVRPPSAAEREAARRLPDEDAELRASLGLPALLLGLSGAAARERDLYQPTCTICGLVSGYTGPGSKTVLPAEARAKIDFRLVPSQRPERVLELLRAHLDRHGFGDVAVRPLDAFVPPARTPLDHPFVALVAATAERAYGAPPAIIPTMTGSGPMWLFTDVLGLPTASGAGAGYPDTRAHAPNEHIRLRDVLPAVRQAIALLQAMPTYRPPA